jgi:demethylmenaquinone methyltransferase/2-methoxy-6-polyprenyl-1,4-benzoquinol methylase
VLYAGVGRGDDAVEAARLGAQVTALDASPAMLSRLRRRLESRRLDATLVEADLFDHTATGYRWAVASFFLNVFSPPAMRGAVEHLTERLAPDGRLAISDFAPPGPGVVGRAFAHANYWPVALAGRALGLAALHPIYDYQPVLERLGFEIEQRERFGAYESLVARRSRR